MSDIAKKYENLIEFGKIVNSSYEFRKFKKLCVSKIKEFMQCRSAKLYRYDDKQKCLISIDKQQNHIFIQIDETTLVGSCAHFMATLYIRNTENEMKYHREKKLNEDLQAEQILMVPMANKGELLGVIQVSDPFLGKFDDDEINFLESMANILTMTLQNINLFEKQQKQFIQFCESLGDAIGKKDKYTGGHTKRVGVFAEMIGKELGLDFKEMNQLRLAAVLHDLGKIGIEDKILKKRAPLNDEEFKVMQEHPRLGFEILQKVEDFQEIIDGIQFHHERPDGKGYPFALKDDEIPLLARIISVADTFDAMISTRPYRKGLPPMVAYDEILQNSGTQFCPIVVDAFDKAFRKTNMYKSHEKRKKVG